MGLWVAGVAVGALLIALGGAYEQATTLETSLDDALILLLEPDAEVPETVANAVVNGNAIPLRYHQLPAPDDAQEPNGILDVLGAAMPSGWLLAAEGAAAGQLAALLEPLLDHGALPRPGETGLVAGPGTRTDTIVLGPATLPVAGRLGAEAGLFYGKHIAFDTLPPEAAAASPEVRQAFLFLEREPLRAALAGDEEGSITLQGGMFFAPGLTIALAILGLLIVAICGSIAWIRLLQNLAGRGGPLFRPAFDACLAEAPLLLRTHAILYGIFFAMMILGLLFTDTYVALLAFVRGIFTDGQLSDIGDAYESGNILAAKFQTWRHNYLVATVLLSALPSLFLPGAALLKNALSFALLGFVMVPVLAGTARVMSFHSITMWLELEAYILVSFAALLIPVWVIRAFAEPAGDPQMAYRSGALVLVSMTLLAGIILLAAALYEATTLILLR